MQFLCHSLALVLKTNDILACLVHLGTLAYEHHAETMTMTYDKDYHDENGYHDAADECPRRALHT